MSFENKVVIVTGASSGIGAATALELTKLGADVVMVARNQTKLEKVAAECAGQGKHPLILIADLAKDDQVKRIMEETIAQYGKLDVLVNNAGYGQVTTFVDDNDAVGTYDHALQGNLRAVVLLTHLAVPYLTQTKGCIVNISSVAALTILSGSWAYCTAKAGLDHFSRCVAAELAPKGIRLNVINSGPVYTDFFNNLGVQDLSGYLQATALKRFSEPEEISNLVVYLASEKAKGVTGSFWVADNGFLLK